MSAKQSPEKEKNGCCSGCFQIIALIILIILGLNEIWSSSNFTSRPRNIPTSAPITFKLGDLAVSSLSLQQDDSIQLERAGLERSVVTFILPEDIVIENEHQPLNISKYDYSQKKWSHDFALAKDTSSYDRVFLNNSEKIYCYKIAASNQITSVLGETLGSGAIHIDDKDRYEVHLFGEQLQFRETGSALEIIIADTLEPQEMPRIVEIWGSFESSINSFELTSERRWGSIGLIIKGDFTDRSTDKSIQIYRRTIFNGALKVGRKRIKLEDHGKLFVIKEKSTVESDEKLSIESQSCTDWLAPG